MYKLIGRTRRVVLTAAISAAAKANPTALFSMVGVGPSSFCFVFLSSLVRLKLGLFFCLNDFQFLFLKFDFLKCMLGF